MPARREAYDKAQQPDGPFRDYVARFLSVCSADQIRLAPEKCEPASLHPMDAPQLLPQLAAHRLPPRDRSVTRRRSPAAVCGLCRRYKELLVGSGTPRLGILPLEAAIRKLQPSREHLTPMHADFLQL